MIWLTQRLPLTIVDFQESNSTWTLTIVKLTYSIHAMWNSIRHWIKFFSPIHHGLQVIVSQDTFASFHSLHLRWLLLANSYVSLIDEDLLYDVHQLGMLSPWSLLTTLIYTNTKHFNLKSADAHMAISFANFGKYSQWVRLPAGAPQGQQMNYLRFYAHNPGRWYSLSLLSIASDKCILSILRRSEVFGKRTDRLRNHWTSSRSRSMSNQTVRFLCFEVVSPDAPARSSDHRYLLLVLNKCVEQLTCSTCVPWWDRLRKARFGSLRSPYQQALLIKFSIVLSFSQIFTLKPNLWKQVQHHSALIRSLHHPQPPQTSISFYLVDLFVCNARCSEQPHTFVQVILVLWFCFLLSVCFKCQAVCVPVCVVVLLLPLTKKSKANNKWRCSFL